MSNGEAALPVPQGPRLTETPYPQVGKYKGRGSTDDASNFIASTPAR